MTIFILSKLDAVIYCFKAARKPSYKCRYFVEAPKWTAPPPATRNENKIRNNQNFVMLMLNFCLDFFDAKLQNVSQLNISIQNVCSIMWSGFFFSFAPHSVLSLKFRQTVIQFSSHFPCEWLRESMQSCQFYLKIDVDIVKFQFGFTAYQNVKCFVSLVRHTHVQFRFSCSVHNSILFRFACNAIEFYLH